MHQNGDSGLTTRENNLRSYVRSNSARFVDVSLDALIGVQSDGPGDTLRRLTDLLRTPISLLTNRDSNLITLPECRRAAVVLSATLWLQYGGQPKDKKLLALLQADIDTVIADGIIAAIDEAYSDVGTTSRRRSEGCDSHHGRRRVNQPYESPDQPECAPEATDLPVELRSSDLRSSFIDALDGTDSSEVDRWGDDPDDLEPPIPPLSGDHDYWADSDKNPMLTLANTSCRRSDSSCSSKRACATRRKAETGDR